MVITLLKNFAFVAANGQSWNTDWLAFPAEFKNAQLVVECKSRIAGTLTVQGQTTWDTDAAANVGSAATVNAVGVTQVDVTTGLGPMFRLNLAASVADASMIISVWLTPKSE